MEKEFFMPGDLVTIKHDLPNKPIMMIKQKKTTTIKTEDNKSEFFQGMICRWFTTNGELQEAVFSTKDIIKINK